MVTQSLNAWMNGELVGTWLVDRNSHAFRYDPSGWSRPPAIALALLLISGSLEIQGQQVRNYFDNLLPDNETDPLTAAKALQSALGRDLRPAGSHRPGLRRCRAAPARGRHPGRVGIRIDCEPLTEAQIVDLLQAVPSDTDPGSIHDDDLFRISIAGAQGEDRAHPVEGQMVPAAWRHAHHPHHQAAAGSHQWLEAGRCVGLRSRTSGCARRSSRNSGCPSPPRRWRPSANRPCWSSSGSTGVDGQRTWIARLPQEDFCQALGVAPDQKYEQGRRPHAEVHAAAAGAVPTVGHDLFLLTQLAFLLMAATDGRRTSRSISIAAMPIG